MVAITDSARSIELKQREEDLVFVSFDHHHAWGMIAPWNTDRHTAYRPRGLEGT